MGGNAVLPARNVQEYFRDLLGRARENQRVRMEEATEFYLVNLLSRFADADRLFTVTEDGTRDQEPLALMLARALEQSKPERVSTLRKLGDVSLYISGFFSDSLGSKLVNVDYYIAMGGRAYASVHQLVRVMPGGAQLTEVYAELSDRFGTIVNLFCEIAERSAIRSDRSLLRLYESWMRTGNARLARLLQDRGVLPEEYLSKKPLPS